METKRRVHILHEADIFLCDQQCVDCWEGCLWGLHQKCLAGGIGRRYKGTLSYNVRHTFLPRLNCPWLLPAQHTWLHFLATLRAHVSHCGNAVGENEDGEEKRIGGGGKWKNVYEYSARHYLVPPPPPPPPFHVHCQMGDPWIVSEGRRRRPRQKLKMYRLSPHRAHQLPDPRCGGYKDKQAKVFCFVFGCVIGLGQGITGEWNCWPSL